MNRIALKFSRKSMSKYLSHLDMQRTFSRALRRSGINVKTSSGFNPHIVLSFASALSVGMESEGEYVEFTVLNDINTEFIKTKLNEVLPSDIRIIDAYIIPDNVKKLMSIVHAAKIKYESNDSEFLNAVAEFLKKKECLVEKRSKKGIKVVDIMPYIYSVEISDDVSFIIAHSNDASLNPFMLLDQIKLCSHKIFDVSVSRLELFDPNFRPLNSLFV